MIFYALDGDNIGSQLEGFIYRGDEEGLIEFHKAFTLYLDEIKQKFEELGVRTVFCAGERKGVGTLKPLNSSISPQKTSE